MPCVVRQEWCPFVRRKMADSTTKSPQSINVEEADDLSTVTITLVIPGFEVKKGLFGGGAKPKTSKCKVDPKFDTMSVECTAEVFGDSGNATRYHYKVNKLPGEIDPSSCKIEFKKDLVILKLAKKDETSWAVLIRSGLDQAPTSD